jgi:uncharacterized membrane protein YgaE (UPF0421/DUF939 family)
VDVTQVLVVIVTTAGTVLGSSAAWRFWEIKLREKTKQAEIERKDEHTLRDDLRERLAVLESKLEKSDQEKNDMQKEVLRLVEKLAALSVEVEFLRKENADLKQKLSKANN